MKAILDCISDDRLEEAIELLATVSENVNDILKELILLKSRLSDMSRNYRQGIIGDDDKNLEKNKIRVALIDLTLELKAEMKEMNALHQATKQDIDKLPYPNFRNKFRELIDPYYIASSKSYLHVVFGSIADVENMSIAVGCSQDFDLFQIDTKSVLGALLNIKVGDQNAIEAVNEIWPASERPQDAGLGMSHFVELPTNSNNMEGVIFTVTTRDISANELDKGIYTNTPVQGIPIVLDKVFTQAKHHNISALALPLLGAGHANIARTRHDPALKTAVEKAILAITIDESMNQFLASDETLRRIVIVVFSEAPQSEREHGLWELAIRMLHPNSEKRIKIIDELVDKITG